ncbi:FecR family protein [Dysgonomonas sp. BGC7]|uniref:FecR family protein n=1 Tax=Dysgonomonas sp. BGC7 TaxID=1658008 RepID=UPI0006808ED9|nr:FecR domain-containing protein [Dysgonomonas sp. BGC7]MBD8387130.1 DUF4974 domain-containing protein [Dysgonomonas sp. BGC7]
MDGRQEGVNLIICKLLGKITSEQEAELNNWINESAENKRIYEKLISADALLEKKELYDSIDTDIAYNSFLKRIGRRSTFRRYFLQYSKYAAIAIVLIMVAVGTYFVMKPADNPVDMYSELNKISNRGSQATLILADGEEIALVYTDGSEKIILEDSSAIKNENNSIDYSETTSPKSNTYNTLITSPGKEYSVTLSDGTTVHLNSASTLKFPVNFQGDIREVVLEGEGYFTIAKDTKRPFIVHTKGIAIRQYGTVFNVNTHSQSKIEIVLVEGSIGVTPPNSAQVMIKPYQLAEYNEQEEALSVRNVDIDPYISWHRGELIFENKSMKDIMNTLSLWYGVDIVIDNKDVEKLHFTGKMNRYDKIDNILRAVEQTADIKFSVRDNIVHVNKSLK